MPGGTDWVKQQREAVREQGIDWIARKRLQITTRLGPLIVGLEPMIEAAPPPPSNETSPE